MIKMITIQNQWVVNTDANQAWTSEMVYVMSRASTMAAISIVMLFRMIDCIGSIEHYKNNKKCKKLQMPNMVVQ